MEFKNQRRSLWIKETEAKPPYDTPVLVVNEDGLYAIAEYKQDKTGRWVDEWRIFYTPYDSDGWDDNEYGRLIAWMQLPRIKLTERWQIDCLEKMTDR